MPLFWLSIAFIIGLVLGMYYPLDWTIGLGVGALFFAFGFLEQRFYHQAPFLEKWRNMTRLPVAIALAFIGFGAARYNGAQSLFSSDDLAWYNDLKQDVVVWGMVDSPPEYRDSGVIMSVSADLLQLDYAGDFRQISGRLAVYSRRIQNWNYGDRVELRGRLKSPNDGVDFSYKDYLARYGIHSSMAYPGIWRVATDMGNPFIAWIYHLRDYLNQTIQENLPSPESGLLSGILIGIDRDIPSDLQDDFKATGTAHIYVISGFNIAILLAITAAFLERILPYWWSFWLSLFIIGIFSLLVGGDPPVVRAAIMGGVSLLGKKMGRRQAGLNSLCFIAGLMCFFSPLLLWDVSFQLTFFAVLGLVLFGDKFLNFLKDWVRKRVTYRPFRWLLISAGEYVLVTFAAQLTTVPIMIYYFGRFSFSTLLANLLILPVQPMVMVVGLVAVVGLCVFGSIAMPLMYAAWVPLAYTTQVVQSLARLLPWEVVLPQPQISSLLIYYLLLLLIPYLIQRKLALQKYVSFVLVLLALSVSAILVWKSVLDRPDGLLHLVLLDVPDGPAILAQTPDGRYFVINGSSNERELKRELSRWLPLFQQRLDYWIITQQEKKYFDGAFPVMAQFKPDHVLWDSDNREELFRTRMNEVSKSAGVDIVFLQAGQKLDLGRGAGLSVLATRYDGKVILLDWNNFRFFMPSGMPLEELLPMNVADGSVLLLSSSDLRDSTGYDGQYKRAAIVLSGENLGHENIGDQLPLYSTRKYGWIAITTDGFRMWIVSKK